MHDCADTSALQETLRPSLTFSHIRVLQNSCSGLDVKGDSYLRDITAITAKKSEMSHYLRNVIAQDNHTKIKVSV